MTPSERYQSDPERFKEETRIWQLNNPEKVKKYKADYKARNPLRSLLHAAKKRAAQYNVPYDLVFEDIIVPAECPILGIALQHNKGKVGDNSPSVDRIIPELGYTKTNIRVISYKANRYKSNLSREQFQRFIDYIDGRLQ